MVHTALAIGRDAICRHSSYDIGWVNPTNWAR